MGTRSYIGKDIGNGKYSVIFCQLESYLETTGRLLTEHYNTPEKVDALLALGDIRIFFQSREDILPGGVLSLYRTGRLCVKRSSLAAGWSSLCTDFWGIENDSRRKADIKI